MKAMVNFNMTLLYIIYTVATPPTPHHHMHTHTNTETNIVTQLPACFGASQNPPEWPMSFLTSGSSNDENRDEETCG